MGQSTPTGESGKGSWTWELTDPNGAFTIPPLAGCDSATDGLPIISGGYQKTVTGDVMVYQAYHGEKVVPFYQKEMVAGGWKQIRRAHEQGWGRDGGVHQGWPESLSHRHEQGSNQ